MHSVTAKPRTGPGAELEEDQAGDQRGDVGVHDGRNRVAEALVNGRARRAPGGELLSYSFEDEDVGVHGHPDGEDQPGDPGQGQVRVEDGQPPEHEEHVHAQREKSPGVPAIL